VGAYHASSLLVASRAPPPGVVSRSIALEGLTSILAGFWGTGAGATTLTENVHTIAVTKMGSRRPVEVGACILILLSVVGKVISDKTLQRNGSYLSFSKKVSTSRDHKFMPRGIRVYFN
jgi:xanthine/uracil permease